MSWRALGRPGASWSDLGTSGGRLGCVLGSSWRVLEGFGSVLGASWRVLEPSLGRLRAVLASIISDVENNGKHRTRSASEAPNASHRHFEQIETSVAAVWRVRGAPGSTLSTVLNIFDIILDAILDPFDSKKASKTNEKKQQFYKPVLASEREAR